MKRIAIFVFFITVLPLIATGQITERQITDIMPHPRILMLTGDEQTVMYAVGRDTLLAKVHNAVLEECDAILEQATNTVFKNNSTTRGSLKRIMFLAYAFRTTSEERYARRAIEEMLSAASADGWHGDYLVIAELTSGMAIGYDWLYDRLSDRERQDIARAIVDYGIRPSEGEAGYHFLHAVSNWNLACNTGMALGSLAVADVYPEYSRKILNRTIDSFYIKQYSPDGNYSEGYGYWGYGTNNVTMAIDALQKCFGTDFGLSATEGFMQTAYSVLHEVGPTGECFNFADTKTGTVINPAAFWFAEQNGDHSLLWNERRIIVSNIAKVAEYRMLPLLMIWGKNIDLQNLPAPEKLLYVGDGITPVACMRSSWTDPNALYIAAKAGTTAANHAHMDAGTYVLEADGVRWVIDLGLPNYTAVINSGTDYFRLTDADEQLKKILLKPNIPYLKVSSQDAPR